MSYVEPVEVVADEFVDEDDWNILVNDIIFLAANLVPVGAITPYIATAAPSGWLLCDGSAVSRATYAALYALTGDAYGAGNGTTTFNLPDLRFRVPLGKAASGTGSSMGSTGGSANAINVSHNHTQNSHNHTQDAHDHFVDDNATGSHEHNAEANQFVITTGAGPYYTAAAGNQAVTFTTDTQHAGTHNHDIDANPTTATNQATTATNNSAGSSGTDANLQPFQVFTYIIKH